MSNVTETHNIIQTEGIIGQFPEIDTDFEDNSATAFKQAMQKHNTYNKAIVKTHFTNKASFENKLSEYKSHNKQISRAHFSKKSTNVTTQS